MAQHERAFIVDLGFVTGDVGPEYFPNVQRMLLQEELWEVV